MSKYNFSVIKASGEREPFSLEQYTKSLRRAGLSEIQIKNVLKNIEPYLYDGISTQKLYEKTFELIALSDAPCASRYSLKESLRRMGPTGFPFEKLIARILQIEGFEIKTDQIIPGKCVRHEIDVLGYNDEGYTIVEAKFHEKVGFKTSVKTVLYVKARFDDLSNIKKNRITNCLLITNAKFTSEAIAYGKCQKIKLIAWGYPLGRGIDDLINKYRLFPITTLISLNKEHKDRLLSSNIILCQDVIDSPEKLKNIGFDSKLIEKIKEECKILCY